MIRSLFDCLNHDHHTTVRFHGRGKTHNCSRAPCGRWRVPTSPALSIKADI
jgi:hypothetical protein